MIGQLGRSERRDSERTAELEAADSELKGVEQSPREEVVRLKHFLEIAQVIPWEADARSWVFTYVGPQAVEILGHPVESWYENGFWVHRMIVNKSTRQRPTCLLIPALYPIG